MKKHNSSIWSYERVHIWDVYFVIGVKFAQSVTGSSLDSVQPKSSPVHVKQHSSHLYVTAITLQTFLSFSTSLSRGFKKVNITQSPVRGAPLLMVGVIQHSELGMICWRFVHSREVFTPTSSLVVLYRTSKIKMCCWPIRSLHLNLVYEYNQTHKA